MAAGTPLPSSEEQEEAEEKELESEIDREDARPRPGGPAFQFTTMLYMFLFLLGIIMLFDVNTRNLVAGALDALFSPTIALGGQRPLITMFLAAALEMLITAAASNYTTDWAKAARVQKWSSALGKATREALRSGKKDRIDALKEHQSTLTKLSSEVTFAQLKSMAITWFLIIAIYTWVGLFVGLHTVVHPASAVVSIAGASVNLTGPLGGLPIPTWFVLFSIFTIPLSLVFRRILKHYSLSRHPAILPPAASGDSA
jgi:uncharacterized membrane protein (DUF106 family)